MDTNIETKIAESLDRIAKILAGLLLRDIEEGEQTTKIYRLKGCGFSNTEIAEILQTTPNTVGVALHSLRKNKSRAKRKNK
jgi:DNA-binding NarL/FixJ family response regulator